ncbi:hypothetical protein Q3H58_000644 [Pseudomonas psychrotolerans]|nr:hypothetical protein [Pseudomonas psychrotolerans]
MVGYRCIHLLNRWGTWVMGAGLLAGFTMMLSQPLPTDFLTRGSLNASGFIATLSLGVIWQLSFSPYTSDYSRYLPESVGIARPFWATYLGATLGTILAFSFGMVAVLAAPQGHDAMAAVAHATGWLGPVLMVLFLLNIISHNALNLYGAVLSLITCVQTFAAGWTPGVRFKVMLSSLVLVGCAGMALMASADFIERFIGLVLAMTMILVPWAAINLIRLLSDQGGRLPHSFAVRRGWRSLRPFQRPRHRRLCRRYPGAVALRQHGTVQGALCGVGGGGGPVVAGRPVGHLSAVFLAGLSGFACPGGATPDGDIALSQARSAQGVELAVIGGAQVQTVTTQRLLPHPPFEDLADRRIGEVRPRQLLRREEASFQGFGASLGSNLEEFGAKDQIDLVDRSGVEDGVGRQDACPDATFLPGFAQGGLLGALAVLHEARR